MSIPREQVASALKGQSFRLPDFEAVHRDWPIVTSNQVEWMRGEVDNFIQWYVRCKRSYTYVGYEVSGSDVLTTG